MDLAFFDPRDFAEWDQDGVVLAPSVEIDSRSIRAIKSVQSNPRTGTKIEFNDRLKALELLGRHQGLFNDKLTIAGDPENPLLNVDKTLEFLTKLATGKETTE